MREKRIVEIKVVSNAGKEFDKAGKGAKGAAGGIGALGAAATAATGAIGRMTAALLANPFTAIAAAIAGAVSAFRTIISTSSEFEFQMDKVAAVTGATTDQMVMFKKEAMRLGAATEYTATQVAQLQLEFSKLGFSVQDVINATDATLDLATATGVDLAEAARVTGASLNAFGLSTIETQGLMDVMAKSFSSSALDMAKFSSGISNAAAAAKVMGVSVEETVSAMSILNNAGIDAGKVGTDLRKIFTEVGKTTGKDFRESLDALAEEMEKAGTKTEKMAVLTEAVGQRSAVATSILIDQRDILDQLTTSYENASGSLGEMADTMRDNARTSMELLKSAWNGFILSIEDGDGALQKFYKGSLNTLTMFITNLTERFKFLNTVGAAQWDAAMLKMKKGLIQARIALIDASIALNNFFGFDTDAETLLMVDKLRIKVGQLNQDIINVTKDGWKKYADSIVQVEKTQTEALKKVNDEVVEDTATTADEIAEVKITKEQQFQDKLRRMIEDAEDKSETQKLERKRQRHLAELENLNLTEVQKGELRLSINEYYDNLIASNKKKTSKYYADQIDAYDAEQAEKKAKREEEHQAKMISLRDNALDSMAQAFGEETAAAKAVHAFKTALKIKEILLEAGLIKVKAGADQAETVAEAQKGGAKALGSGNPLKIALAVAAIGAVVATSIKSMKKTKSAADKMAAKAGGSAGGSESVSSPSFNVIGATSADGNLIASQVANANSKPVRAYVVESEMSSMQEAARKVKTVASI